jgi:hypothetical protein
VLLDARAAAVGNSPRGKKKAAPKKGSKAKAAPNNTPEIGDEASARPLAKAKPATARKKPAAKAKKPSAAAKPKKAASPKVTAAE